MYILYIDCYTNKNNIRQSERGFIKHDSSLVMVNLCGLLPPPPQKLQSEENAESAVFRNSPQANLAVFMSCGDAVIFRVTRDARERVLAPLLVV